MPSVVLAGAGIGVRVLFSVWVVVVLAGSGGRADFYLCRDAGSAYRSANGAGMVDFGG